LKANKARLLLEPVASELNKMPRVLASSSQKAQTLWSGTGTNISPCSLVLKGKVIRQ
jgi:hypothetical protein